MADFFTPTQPDYTVSAMDKSNDKVLKGNVGVAWKNTNGSIRIKLNPFVVLDTTKHDLVITLFPFGQQQGGSKKPAKQDKPVSEDYDAFKDETPY